MGAVANMKEIVGVNANKSSPTATIPSAATLNIPDDGSMFYVSGSTTVTSIMPDTVMPGRKITLMPLTSTITFTHTSVSSFPGVRGNFFSSIGAATVGKGQSLTLKQLDTGAWAQTGFGNNV